MADQAISVMDSSSDTDGDFAKRGDDTGVKRKRIFSDTDLVDIKDKFRTAEQELLHELNTSSSGKPALNRSQYENLVHGLGKLREIFTDVLLERENLRGRCEEQDKFRTLIERLDRETSAGVAARPSTSKAPAVVEKLSVGGGSSGVVARSSGGARPRSYALVVRSAGDTELSPQDVKKRVLGSVKKAVGPLRVNAVREVRHGVAIEVADLKTLETLKASKKFTECGLKAESPRKIGPKLIVYDVPEEFNKAANLVDEIYKKKNIDKSVTAAADYLSRTRVVSHRGSTAIVEVTPAVKTQLLRTGRVYLGWCGCRVREIDVVQRCHRCYAVGHMAKECKLDGNACRKCGKEGHLGKDCKSLSESCRNCQQAGKPAGHSVFSRECPANIVASRRARSKTLIQFCLPFLLAETVGIRLTNGSDCEQIG